MSTSNYFDNKTCFLEPKVEQFGSSMVMTNVHKPTKKRFVNIDSRFIENEPSVDQEYTLNLSERISDVKSIRVHSVQIPMSFFNVSSILGNNSVYVDSMEVPINIQDSFYSDIGSLITEINATLSSHNLHDIVVSNTNNQIMITNNSTTKSHTIYWNYSQDKIKSSLGWILGFRKHSYIIPHGKHIISEKVYNLATIRYIYLILDEFASSLQNTFVSSLPRSSLNKNILARIEIDMNFYPFGTILRANEFTYLCSERRVYKGKTDLLKLKLQLVNEWGNPIDLNGLDWGCLLEVDYE